MITNYDEIKTAVLEITVGEPGELLGYRGRTYCLDYTPDKIVADCKPSTLWDGGDIYIGDDVPEKFRRSIILHEVIEADLHFHQGFSFPDSHKKAEELDKRFAAETLDSKTLSEYETFRADA